MHRGVDSFLLVLDRGAWHARVVDLGLQLLCSVGRSGGREGGQGKGTWATGQSRDEVTRGEGRRVKGIAACSMSKQGQEAKEGGQTRVSTDGRRVLQALA